MSIDRQELREALLSCLEDDAVLDRLTDRLSDKLAERIETTVNFAVAAAVADKDREIRELKLELQETANQVNELEQYSRKQCINVKGVPESQGENVAQLVLQIAGAAGVELSPSDVDVAHRVGRPRDGRHRAIIARFASFTARQKVYDKRRELRNATAVAGSAVTTEALRQVYVSDSLTKRNEETMYYARQMKKNGIIWAAWTDNGKMKIKLERNGPTKIINSTEHLRELVGDRRDPAPPAAGPGAAPAGGPGAAAGTGGTRRADLPPRGDTDSARGGRRQQPPRAAAAAAASGR